MQRQHLYDMFSWTIRLRSILPHILFYLTHRKYSVVPGSYWPECEKITNQTQCKRVDNKILWPLACIPRVLYFLYCCSARMSAISWLIPIVCVCWCCRHLSSCILQLRINCSQRFAYNFQFLSLIHFKFWLTQCLFSQCPSSTLSEPSFINSKTLSRLFPWSFKFCFWLNLKMELAYFHFDMLCLRFIISKRRRRHRKMVHSTVCFLICQYFFPILFK